MALLVVGEFDYGLNTERYTISKGIKVWRSQLHDGKKILIGTQKPEELKTMITSITSEAELKSVS